MLYTLAQFIYCKEEMLL